MKFPFGSNLPHLQSTLVTDYVYIRPNTDCYTCYGPTNAREFTVYSNYNLGQLYPISSENTDTQIIDQGVGFFKVRVSSLLGEEDGEPGYFSIVRAGGENNNGIIETKQPIWVGLPEAVPSNSFTGPNQASSNDWMFHVLDNRIAGIEFYGWDFPEPNEIIWGGEISDPTIWSHIGYDKYIRFTSGYAGNQTGYVRPYGINPCGLGNSGDNQICVVNLDDPQGDTSCDEPDPTPIVYYPNPADDLLAVDLSLQNYDIFTVTVYNDNQFAVYTDQSTNVVKTVETFNLANGTYYLHIYDGSNDLILSKILVINH